MLSAISNLVVLGAGKMGMALARGWVANGLSPSALTLVDPGPHESVEAWAAEHNVNLVSAAPQEPAQVILLAVKPQVADAVMAQNRHLVNDDTLILSIVAGFSIAQLQAGFSGGRVVRTMPNTPAQVGKGVTGLIRGEGVSDHGWALTQALFSVSGLVVVLPDESDIDALTALSGSGPAYVFHLVEAMAAAGAGLGLEEQTAMTLARQTVIGAAELMEQDDTDAGTLRQNVTSPNGVTYEALKVLMGDQGLGNLMLRAMRAARDRSVELGG